MDGIGLNLWVLGIGIGLDLWVLVLDWISGYCVLVLGICIGLDDPLLCMYDYYKCKYNHYLNVTKCSLSVKNLRGIG